MLFLVFLFSNTENVQESRTFLGFLNILDIEHSWLWKYQDFFSKFLINFWIHIELHKNNKKLPILTNHRYPITNHDHEQRPSLPGTFHILIGKFSYFVIRFWYYIFFFVMRFYYSPSILRTQLRDPHSVQNYDHFQ